jgi:hypothetical protein
MKNNLKSIRKQMRINQKELAVLLGCSAGNVSHYENQTQNIPSYMAEKIIKVAKARNVDITMDDIYDVSKLGSVYSIGQRPEVKPQVLSDALGGKCIVLDGRVFISINFLPAHIDKVGMDVLAQKVAGLITGQA